MSLGKDRELIYGMPAKELALSGVKLSMNNGSNNKSSTMAHEPFHLHFSRVILTVNTNYVLSGRDAVSV